MAHTIDTEDLAHDLAEANGWEVLVTGDHVQFAAPTTGECCPTQTTGPMWDWIENGLVKGGMGTQCGGCGGYGRGWTTSPSTQVLSTSHLHLLAEEFAVQAKENLDHETQKVRDRVQRRLDEALQVVQTADPADWLSLFEDPGSETEPGVYIDGDHLASWDYAPGPDRHDDSAIIEAYERIPKS